MLVEIKKIVYPGRSLAHYEGRTVFTDEGLPGETVEIRAAGGKKGIIEAETIRVLRASPHRIPPRCPHYRACAPYQYIDYAHQLEIKRDQVREIFSRHPAAIPEISEVIPSPVIWGYRNRIRLRVVREAGIPRLAYHRPGSRKEFISLDACHLASDRLNAALSEAIGLIRTAGWRSIKEIEVKESSYSREILGILHLESEEEVPAIRGSFPRLREMGGFAGLVGAAPAKAGVRTLPLGGKSDLTDAAGGCMFRIGPRSFFQVNAGMLERVIQDIHAVVSRLDSPRVADLYCGLGTFGICLAAASREVFGVESMEENVRFLKKNIGLNHSGNFNICEGTSEEWISSILERRIDVVILDPPRKGAAPRILESLLRSPVRLIIYLSCNPTTLVRDLGRLLPGYQIDGLKIYDFFPHTPHIETCAVLSSRLSQPRS